MVITENSLKKLKNLHFLR